MAFVDGIVYTHDWWCGQHVVVVSCAKFRTWCWWLLLMWLFIHMIDESGNMLLFRVLNLEHDVDGLCVYKHYWIAYKHDSYDFSVHEYVEIVYKHDNWWRGQHMMLMVDGFFENVGNFGILTLTTFCSLFSSAFGFWHLCTIIPDLIWDGWYVNCLLNSFEHSYLVWALPFNSILSCFDNVLSLSKSWVCQRLLTGFFVEDSLARTPLARSTCVGEDLVREWHGIFQSY